MTQRQKMYNIPCVDVRVQFCIYAMLFKGSFSLAFGPPYFILLISVHYDQSLQHRFVQVVGKQKIMSLNVTL